MTPGGEQILPKSTGLSSSSGVSSANSQELVTSSDVQITSSDGQITPSDQLSNSLNGCDTGASSQPIVSNSPPPVSAYRAEFSFSEARLEEVLCKPRNLDDSGVENILTPTPEEETPEEGTPVQLGSEVLQNNLKERVRRLEQELEAEKQRVRERDLKIAELEHKLLQYQISELKVVMD